MIRSSSALLGTALLVLVATSCASTSNETPATDEARSTEPAVPVHFLEIVTPEVEATCALLAKEHGVNFTAPDPMTGMARSAALRGGGRISVRAPLRDTEEPVVRPYLLVEDIEAAVAAAAAAGGKIAMAPMEIPGQGRFAIYLLGGIDHGLWQL